MRYFLDCEYDGFSGPLVSLALVPEDGGEEFYVVLTHERPLTEWVERHVAPYLWMVPEPFRHDPLGREQAAILLSSWLAGLPEIEILADWPEDLALFCSLLTIGSGRMVPVPPLTVRLITPVAAPLHNTLVTTVLSASAGGCVTVALVVAVQPLTSVTVTV